MCQASALVVSRPLTERQMMALRRHLVMTWSRWSNRNQTVRHMTKGVDYLVPNHSAVYAVTLSAGDKTIQRKGKKKTQKRGVEQGCLILPHSIPSAACTTQCRFGVGGNSGLCPWLDNNYYARVLQATTTTIQTSSCEPVAPGSDAEQLAAERESKILKGYKRMFTTSSMTTLGQSPVEQSCGLGRTVSGGE